MGTNVRIALLLAASFALHAAPAAAQAMPDPYALLAGSEAAANGRPGPRTTPSKVIPPPTADLSPQDQALIAGPFSPIMNADPKSAAEWKALIAARAQPGAELARRLAERFHLKVEPVTLAGVKAYDITPATLSNANRNRLLMHVHGGGYVFSPGEAALPEALLLAGIGGFRVVSVDYRMPPDAPYPAAMDDALAVWRELIKTNDPRRMAVFGTSTGGGMTLALVLRAKAEGVALPAAIAPGTPWSDLTETGDTYQTNEWVDNVLVTWKGWLGRAALLYAAGHDLKDPMLSPIYGDFTGFPPAILTSGTRDLFLSNTVRTHRKLRRAGVEADLNVYEGQSHAQYIGDPDAPETKEAVTDIATFFDHHLAR